MYCILWEKHKRFYNIFSFGQFELFKMAAKMAAKMWQILYLRVLKDNMYRL